MSPRPAYGSRKRSIVFPHSALSHLKVRTFLPRRPNGPGSGTSETSAKLPAWQYSQGSPFGFAGAAFNRASNSAIRFSSASSRSGDAWIRGHALN